MIFINAPSDNTRINFNLKLIHLTTGRHHVIICVLKRGKRKPVYVLFNTKK